MLYRHSLKSVNAALKLKGISDFVYAVLIKDEVVTVKDIRFGEYFVDLKSFAPSSIFPLHKDRKHAEKLKKLKFRYLNQTIRGVHISDIFYGPERGYKNRSFYFRYKGLCGHDCISTLLFLKNKKNRLKCSRCGHATVHGERKRQRGVLGKRSPEYISWVSQKAILPEKYKNDFILFKSKIGDKPSQRAKISLLENGEPFWESLILTIDRDLNFIANAVRQAFRYSKKYAECIASARIETEDGVRYRCNQCGKLFKRKEIQVDHVKPISDITGETILTRENVISIVWDSEIQILDKSCHKIKTKAENDTRRLNKLYKRYGF